MQNWEKNIYNIAGSLVLVSQAFHASASTFYEEDGDLVASLIASSIFFTIFVFYLKWQKWAYNLSIWYAFWAISMNLFFHGKSTPYYGELADIMNVWELIEIFIGFLIAGVFFLPGIRAYFKLNGASR